MIKENNKKRICCINLPVIILKKMELMKRDEFVHRSEFLRTVLREWLPKIIEFFDKLCEQTKDISFPLKSTVSVNLPNIMVEMLEKVSGSIMSSLFPSRSEAIRTLTILFFRDHKSLFTQENIELDPNIVQIPEMKTYKILRGKNGSNKNIDEEYYDDE